VQQPKQADGKAGQQLAWDGMGRSVGGISSLPDGAALGVC
jgi:hypothetical protein